jgi:hypothetical protein
VTPAVLRPVPDLPGVLVDHQGRVYKLRGDSYQEVKGYRRPDGYIRFTFRHPDGRRCHRFGHQLTLRAFHGPRPEGAICRHLNSTRDDNRPENLRYGSYLDNTRDRQARGLTFQGERNPSAKLKEQDVHIIRVLASMDVPVAKIAARFRVGEKAVRDIVNWKSWTHLARAA